MGAPPSVEFVVEMPRAEGVDFAEKYDQHPAHLGEANPYLPGDSVPGLYLIVKVLNRLRQEYGTVLCGTSMKIRWKIPVRYDDRISVRATWEEDGEARRSTVSMARGRDGVEVGVFTITHLMNRDSAC